jgi:hypothetical protein
MDVLDLEKGGVFLPAIPLGKERSENKKLYRKRRSVEKRSTTITAYE